MKKRSNQVAKVEPAPVVQSRSVVADEELSYILRSATNQINWNKEKVDTFIGRMKEDPANAFEWSQDTFQAAARLKTSTIIFMIIDDMKKAADEYSTPTSEQIISALARYFKEDMIRGAKWPSRSSSVQHNEMKLNLTAASAETYEECTRALDRIARKGV